MINEVEQKNKGVWSNRWFVFAGASAFLFNNSGCSEKHRIQKECGSPFFLFDKPIPARFGYYTLAYSSLRKFKDRFGYFPTHLDSLTKLDNVSYEHMERAWKLKYQPQNDGQSFSIDEFSQSQIDSIEHEKIKLGIKGVEYSKNWDECKNKIVSQ